MHAYTLKQLKSSMPLLDSHDTPRIRNICQNDKDKVKLCLLLLLTFMEHHPFIMVRKDIWKVVQTQIIVDQQIGKNQKSLMKTFII